MASVLLKKKTKAFIRICRPWWLLVYMPIFLGSMFITRTSIPSYDVIILGIIALILGKSGASAINDFFDYDIDKESHPERAIPSGILNRKEAFVFASILTFISLLLAVTISFRISKIKVFLVILSCFVTAFLHFGKIKRLQIPMISVIGTASLAGIVSLSGYVIGNDSIAVGLLLFTMVFIWDLAHDTCSSIRDQKGDNIGGVLTPSNLFGVKVTAQLSFVFFSISYFLAFLLGYLSQLGMAYYSILLISGGFCLIRFMNLLKDQNNYNKVFTALSIYMAVLFIAVCMVKISVFIK